eukprot:CAMPEP_0201556544 /NCGR_PEP_ID=MMETSP0173_2-20130828/56046_1 /ASSEMBLY_ACC=CAM_ASM_000268 /TAXON_ID=218659 /ORGANISM="Vexillifera sp., Strain DIVA3 564/2" /LENGTH=34 /DNA_ID= /DNA_START= /DNA_END= /DNA_ORIENTATION=
MTNPTQVQHIATLLIRSYLSHIFDSGSSEYPSVF